MLFRTPTILPSYRCNHITTASASNDLIERLHRQLKADIEANSDINWAQSQPTVLLESHTATKQNEYSDADPQGRSTHIPDTVADSFSARYVNLLRLPPAPSTRPL